MKFVIAPDSFKGTLTQIEAANIMEQATLASHPSARIVLKPMADGGEGTLDVLTGDTYGWKRQSLVVTGPLGEKMKTVIAVKNGDTAIIEVAKIIGLPLVNKERLNPHATTTYGLGQAIIFALDQGIRHFVICLGGSGTNDGGFAMLQALGVRFYNGYGEQVDIFARSLMEIVRVDFSLLDDRLSECTIDVISDVTNPLYGETGATVIFGPQKGVTGEHVQQFDKAMENYAQLTDHVDGGLAFRQGAGAAGGLGFAFLLLGGKVVSGATYVSEAIHLEEEIQTAQLVITGEGKSDGTTILGKVPGHVANIAKKYNIPCILISGTVDDSLLLEKSFTEIHSLVSNVVSTQQAMKCAREVLYNKTKEIIKEQISW